MKNVIDLEKLEGLILGNWTHFTNISNLMSLCQDIIKKTINNFAKINVIKNNKKYSITRFEPAINGFIVWVDFQTDIDGEFTEGTIEFFLGKNGLEFLKIEGVKSNSKQL